MTAVGCPKFRAAERSAPCPLLFRRVRAVPRKRHETHRIQSRRGTGSCSRHSLRLCKHQPHRERVRAFSGVRLEMAAVPRWIPRGTLMRYDEGAAGIPPSKQKLEENLL